MKKPAANKSRAFSLVELMAVLLLLSVLAAAVTVNLPGRISGKNFDRAMRRISRYDFNVRNFCRNAATAAELKFDLFDGLICLEVDGKSAEKLPAALELTDDLQIEDFASSGDSAYGNTSGVTINAYGNSCSYAIKLTDKKISRWLLVAGMSGQTSIYSDEDKVREILASEQN